MGKYIIEIDDIPYMKTFGNPSLYRAKAFKSLVFDSEGLSKLKKVDEEETVDETYKKGLNDAWEFAKKIIMPCVEGGYSTDELENIFHYNTHWSVLRHFTVSEAMAKVEEYNLKEEREFTKQVKVLADKMGIDKLYAKVAEIKGE